MYTHSPSHPFPLFLSHTGSAVGDARMYSSTAGVAGTAGGSVNGSVGSYSMNASIATTKRGAASLNASYTNATKVCIYIYTYIYIF